MLLKVLLLLTLASAQRVTNKVYFDITIGGRDAGRIVFGLFGDVVPKTVKNFVTLATRRSKENYKGKSFFRIIPGFGAQGGDTTTDNGLGGRSIYGEAFPDENFDIELNKPMQLIMANAGKDTNKSQFFITFVNVAWLQGKHVGFGEVISGQDVVNAMERVGSSRGRPSQRVVIADCGELPMDAEETVGSTYKREGLYIREGHSASPVTVVNLFAAIGFALTVYGAFRHYVK